MILGYYPGWADGFVKEYLDNLKRDGQRRKAEAKLLVDLQILASTWPRPQFVTARLLKGHEPLWEIKREFQGIGYRIFFCVNGQEIWLLHALEKKAQKTPTSDLELAYKRMQNIFTGKIRRA